MRSSTSESGADSLIRPNEPELVAPIEHRRATPTRPDSGATARHFHAAIRAGVNVLRRSALDWFDAGSHLVHGRPGEVADFDRDAVITVACMAPAITVDPVAHMQQLFTNHDLQRLRLGQIDPPEIDENQVLAAAGVPDIRAANRSSDFAADPFVVGLAIGGDPEMFGRELESGNVRFEMGQNRVVEVEVHEFVELS